MPMTYEEKLREEWLEADFLQNVPYDAKAIKTAIADWWLQHHREFVESVRKEIEERIDVLTRGTGVTDRERGNIGSGAEASHAAVRSMRDILRFPSLTVSNK